MEWKGGRVVVVGGSGCAEALPISAPMVRRQISMDRCLVCAVRAARWARVRARGVRHGNGANRAMRAQPDWKGRRAALENSMQSSRLYVCVKWNRML